MQEKRNYEIDDCAKVYLVLSKIKFINIREGAVM